MGRGAAPGARLSFTARAALERLALRIFRILFLALFQMGRETAPSAGQWRGCSRPVPKGRKRDSAIWWAMPRPSRTFFATVTEDGGLSSSSSGSGTSACSVLSRASAGHLHPPPVSPGLEAVTCSDSVPACHLLRAPASPAFRV